LARLTERPEGQFHLTVKSGTTSRELVAVAAELPPSLFVDHIRPQVGGSDVVLVFTQVGPGVAASAPWRDAAARPDVHEAATVAGGPDGWVPDVSAAAVGAAPGLNLYQFAVGELVRAAPDDAAAARIIGMIGRVPPPTFVVLADLLRAAARGGRARRSCCSCDHG
jgi:hypothetical protein